MANLLDINRLDDVKRFLRKLFVDSGGVFVGLLAGRDSLRPYATYVALISQAGTGIPTVANTLENTLGVTVGYSRVSAGWYNITAAGRFGGNRVTVFINQPQNGSAKIRVNNQNQITINTFDAAGVAADAILSATAIEIRAYY